MTANFPLGSYPSYRIPENLGIRELHLFDINGFCIPEAGLCRNKMGALTIKRWAADGNVGLCGYQKTPTSNIPNLNFKTNRPARLIL
jgi:hypothetical protein